MAEELQVPVTKRAYKKRGPKPGKKRGPKPGKRRGPKPGRRDGSGLIGKAVAKQVKAMMKLEKAGIKAQVRVLVAKELKRVLKVLLK